MKKLLLCSALLLLSPLFMACWFTSENYQKCYIAQINTADVFYESAAFDAGGVAHPEAGEISFPATVWVKLQPREGQTEPTQFTLQFKKLPSGSWTTIKTISNPAWTVNFSRPVALFGKGILNNLSGVTAGDDILVRVYVTDGLYENADLANDTTEDGTNGWQDQWVVKLTVSSNERPQ